MQYILLVYVDEQRFASLAEDTKNRVHDETLAWQAELEQAGHARGQLGLHAPSTATTLREKHGRLLLTDGPFAETKELLGGFSIVDCKNLDAALELAKRFPGLSHGLALEVRPCFTGDPRDAPEPEELP